MDYVINEAVGLLNINLLGISKSRAAIFLDSENSRMLLKKQKNIKKIDELHKTTEALRRFGFESAEKYLTYMEKPYISLSDGSYTVSVCGYGAKCDFTDIANVTSVAKTTAKLHNACTQISVPDIETSKSIAINYYEKRLAEARHIKKWLDKRSHLADVDVLFMKKYYEFLDGAEDAAGCIAEYAGNSKLFMCIGEFKEDNVLIDENKYVTLINLENCVLSVSCTDLCQLIRRFVKRGGDPAFIGEIISAYSCERELNSNDIDFIKAYLSFPHKFLALANKHYNSRRVYANSHAFLKLKSEIAYQERILEMVKTI